MPRQAEHMYAWNELDTMLKNKVKVVPGLIRSDTGGLFAHDDVVWYACQPHHVGFADPEGRGVLQHQRAAEIYFNDPEIDMLRADMTDGASKFCDDYAGGGAPTGFYAFHSFHALLHLEAAGQMEITQHFRHALKTWSFWDPDVAGPTPRTGRQPTCTFTTKHLDTIVILAGWAHEVISVPIPGRELLRDPATSIPGWKGPDTFSFMVGVQMHEVRP